MRNPDADILTKDDIKDLSRLCYRDSKAAAKIIYPERFYRDFDKPHDKIFDLLDHSDNNHKVIAAPRGTGKTSIMNLLIPTKRLAFLDARFIVPVSQTQSAAQLQAENLKHEFMNNDMLSTMFSIRKTKNFSKKQWVLEFIDGEQSMIWPKGAQQQVRGMLFQNYRPDLVIVDDLEDDDHLRSEEQRKRLKDWFFGPLYNIVDRGRDDWEIIYIDTLKHEDSLLQDLLDDPSWDSIVLEICDNNYHTKFPNMMPQSRLDDLVARYRAQEQLGTFYREYRNMPVATEDRPIQESFFRYYTNPSNQANWNRPNFNDKGIYTHAVVIDPAKTANLKSNDSALVGGSINVDDGEIYFRDVVNGKFHPDQLYREMIDMVKRMDADVVGVEVTGLNEFATYPIRNELRKHCPGVQLVELHARGGKNEKGKTARVRSLVSFYRQGKIWHNHVNCGGLEGQLLSFPRSKNWDIMDAAAYFVELFEKGKKYARSRQDDIPSQEEIEEEFKELGYTAEERHNPLKITHI